MNTRKVLVSVLTVVVLCGCSDREDMTHFTGDFCELSPRLENVQTNVGEKVIFDKLPDDAVLVAVNGYPLTKKRFNELMVMKAKRYSEEKESNVTYVNNQIEMFKKSYLRLFVNQRLMIDRARELKLFTQKELEDDVNKIIASSAKAKKMTVSQYVKRYQGDFKNFLYETAARLYTDRLVAKHIPPAVKVDEGFLTEVKAEIKRQNDEAKATNAQIRVQMNSWRNDIQKGNITFEALAKDKNEDDYAEEDKPGYWGTFERGTIDDKNVQRAVFALNKNEISEPIEDDEGFHLLKVYDILKAERNSSGRIIQNEARKVGHIFRKKVPLLIEDEDAVLTKDLKYQMQIKAINEYLSVLSTNGTNTIIFPYGKNILR